MRYSKLLGVALAVAILINGGLAIAKENIDKGQEQRTQKKERRQLKAGCEPPSAAVNLDVNNVRARIMNGGDMWWDLVNTARYIIPKKDEAPFRSSLFAGSIWLGG